MRRKRKTAQLNGYTKYIDGKRYDVQAQNLVEAEKLFKKASKSKILKSKNG